MRDRSNHRSDEYQYRFFEIPYDPNDFATRDDLQIKTYDVIGERESILRNELLEIANNRIDNLMLCNGEKPIKNTREPKINRVELKDQRNHEKK